MPKFKVRDRVIATGKVKTIKVNGTVYNYNDLREPGMEYAVMLDEPYSKIVFVGENQLEKLEEAI